MNCEDAKVGDKFIYHGGRLSQSEVMVCVRTSKTRLWCAVNPESARPLMFSKKTGDLVGRGSWSTAGLYLYNEQEEQRLRDERERQELASYFKNWADHRPWRSWDLEHMRQVKAFLDQATKKEDRHGT